MINQMGQQTSLEPTTLENEKQYQSWKRELASLENVDPENEEADLEYVDVRIKALREYISSYEEVHTIISSSDVTEEMDDATYWNTIAVAYDEWNGDL